ncbi:MAG: EAL domain-containing protein, partial [Arenimonas sp.]
FTELKIDQSFVTGCNENSTCMAIVHSSLDLAHRLEIDSVAEGVETQTDWDAMKRAGCRIAQGYFIAKPMQASMFMEFCTQNELRGSAKDHPKEHDSSAASSPQ